jgi:hypothetical protein
MVLNGKTPHSSREVKVSGVFFSSGVDADFDVIFTPTGPWENPTKPFLGAGKNHSRDCTSRYKFLCFPPFHICRFLHRASSRSWIWSSLWTGQLLHAPSNEDQMRFVCVCVCARVRVCVVCRWSLLCPALGGCHPSQTVRTRFEEPRGLGGSPEVGRQISFPLLS